MKFKFKRLRTSVFISAITFFGGGNIAFAANYCGTLSGTTYTFTQDFPNPSNSYCMPFSSVADTVNINSGVAVASTAFPSFYFNNSNINLLSLTNMGTVGGAGSAIEVSGGAYIATLTNGSLSNTSAYIGGSNTLGGVNNTSAAGVVGIDVLNNYGTISGAYYGFQNNSGTLTTLTNYAGATITGGLSTGVYNGGTITTINNSGTLSGTGSSGTYGIYNDGGVISSIVNTSTGTISGADHAIYNSGNGATIGTITNLGTLTGAFGGINNNNGLSNAVITTVNNAQSGLTYVGVLPTYYNIIITSAGYGTLNGTGQSSGSTTFGVSSLSTLRAGTFQNVLTGGIGRGNLSNSTASTGTITGTVTGYRWTLTDDGSNWDLELVSLGPVVPAGPSASNTLSTVQQSAAGLATTYNVQAAALQAGLTYDCNTFDKYGLCASIGGRTGYALTAPVGNQQAGLLVVSHRPDDHFRYGAFADQSVNSAMPNGIKQNNSGPMYGIFGYWNHQKDGMGLGASLTTACSNSNLTVTRNNSLASTEAGSGNTEMSGQAIQAQGTYAVQATDRIKAIPYAGLRYYRVATGGYSEGANANVTNPLTYNGMSQEVFAAVGGVGTSVFLAEKLTGTASVGIQQNLNYKMGNYQGTSAISGLESFSVNMPSNINSMATATAGMNYAVKKNEKLGVNVLWQQQAFSATNTITALATYSIGF